MFRLILINGLILAGTAFGLPVFQESDVQGYLQKFGYLQKTNPETGNFIDEEHFKKAVKTFQTFANLPVTGCMGVKIIIHHGLMAAGVLDSVTKRMMTTPCCSVPDIVDGETAPLSGQTHRRKRFVLEGSKWKIKHLTWSVSTMTNQLTRSDVESQLTKAWKVWSDNADLTFTKAGGGNVDIDIKFARYDHSDCNVGAFDGPGGTLAHAFFPQYGGDAHFDDSETWTTGRSGTNLFQLAAHEFGHSLGLSHSNEQSSLMTPFYRYADNFSLDKDDIAAIQDIYGPPLLRKNNGPPPPPPVPTLRLLPPVPAPRFPSVPSSNICQSSIIDAITMTADGSTYVFKGDLYYQLTDDGIEPGYPRRISDDWLGLPANLDAALTWSDGKTFFFKNDKYWSFYNKSPLNLYPKYISESFPGIPNKVDAAFVWSGNGKTYFIKGTQYWKYDCHRNFCYSHYPKSLSIWNGLPSKIDGAFQWKNGKTFFFSGPHYYRFNDNQFSIETDYPRPSNISWFGCFDEDPYETIHNEHRLVNGKVENRHRQIKSPITDNIITKSSATQISVSIVFVLTVCVLGKFRDFLL